MNIAEKKYAVRRRVGAATSVRREYGIGPAK